jgi:uncharacterized protein YecE (DUF72 family)
MPIRVRRKTVCRMPLSEVWIGTSGWTYGSWRGPFYPQRLATKNWLAWYATQFSTTEINASFYRTPSLEAVKDWRDNTPKDFLFAWKASKFITHWKRLTDKCENSLALIKTLRAWAHDIAKWKRQRRSVFVYFDNDQKSAAPTDARRLIEFLRER